MQSPDVPERTFTRLDHVRLTRLIAGAAGLQADAARAMEDALASGELVASPQVPPTVVTMYSQVLVQDEGADAAPGAAPRKLTLCYPRDAEPAAGFVSVLSPVGVALLGLRLGQTAHWCTPGGQARSARIVAVLFQPEASGDYVT